MRLLLVIDYKLGYLGGAQTAFTQQALALTAAGHTVTVAAPDASTHAALRSEGIETWDAPFRLVLPGVDLPVVRNSRRLRAAVARLLRQQRIDLVLVHSEFGLSAAALQAAADQRVPTMHTVHTFFWRGPRAAWLAAPLITAAHTALTGHPPHRVRLASRRLDSALRGMTLAAARAADLVVSPSHHQAVALRAAGLASVLVLSNTSTERTAGARTGTPLRLLWAARFAPEKRLEVALDAMAIVQRTLGEGAVQLAVAGGSPPRRPLPSSIVFHGRLAPSAVRALMDDAHACLITSVGFDNQPMVAIEAFASGAPVIVSDPTLAVEFGDAAITTGQPSAEALARIIVRLAQDRGLLDAPTAAAREFSYESTPARHAARIEEAFLGITATAH
jgi:glycosyltransferase involved in cell wall biosynthesis